MASIRSYETKDGEKRWLIDYHIPKDIAGTDKPKKVIKKGFTTLKAAKEALRERQNWLDDGTHGQKVQQKRFTFDQLVKEYIKIHSIQPSWERSKSYMVKRLAEDFKGHLLVTISYHSLEKYKAKLKVTPIRIIKRKGKPDKEVYPSDGTVNRYMALLRHMLSRAVVWDMLAANPFGKGDSLQDREESRDRFLSEKEIELFLQHCKVQHIEDFFIIAVNTGMDKGEILRLKWEQVKHGKIFCQKVKTRPKRYIPISPDLAEHFEKIRSRKVVSEYVVVDGKGRRVNDIKRGFKTVCRRAGIHDFRIKDLRHTFASHFIMRSRDIKALQEILGHTTLRMTSRYAHLLDSHKEDQMAKMGGLTNGRSKSGNDVVTFLHSGNKKGLNEIR